MTIPPEFLVTASPTPPPPAAPEPIALVEPVSPPVIDDSPPAPILSPAERVALLLAERDRLEANLGRYGELSSRRAAAEVTAGKCEADIRRVDDEEAAAWCDWGLNPDSEQPPSRRAERGKLTRRRDVALDELDVARRAEGAVVATIRQLHGDIARINGEVFKINLAIAIDRARNIHSQAIEHAAAVADTMTIIIALRQHLAEAISGAQTHDDRARADVLSAAIQSLASLEAPIVRVDAQVLARELEGWRAAMR